MIFHFKGGLISIVAPNGFAKKPYSVYTLQKINLQIIIRGALKFFMREHLEIWFGAPSVTH